MSQLTEAKKNQMLQKIKAIRLHAYAPYSKYLVGACVLSEDDEFFVGCNVENASYGLTICAEVNAIGQLIAAGKKQVKALAVIGTGPELCTPCGRCRQFIREFMAPSDPIFLCNESGIVKTTNIAELLPLSFGPDHLIRMNENKSKS